MVYKRVIFCTFLLLIGFTVHSLFSQPQHTKLIYFDPLDNGNSTALGRLKNTEGEFMPGWGWQTKTRNSQLFITLPKDLPFEGTLEVSLTNFDPWNQNDPSEEKQHIINLWSRPEADKSVFYTTASWINIRTQKNTKYSAGDGLIGFKFLAQPKGVESRDEEYVMRDARWRTDRVYKFKIVWTTKKAYVFVDDVLRDTRSFSGQIEPFRYIFLGKDNLIYGYCAQVGPIWSNLRLYVPEPRVASPVLFSDITAAAGVNGHSVAGFAQGITFADIDEDGYVDILLGDGGTTQAGADLLYLNQGNGVFHERAAAALLNDGGATKGILAADLNNDGHVDLFFANSPLSANDPNGRNALYFNNGSGVFTNVSNQAGISTAADETNGCLALDVDKDGDLDLFVVNVGRPNGLYINNGYGSFTLENRGVEMTNENVSEFGRGTVTCADVDSDGDLDIYVCRSQKGGTSVSNWLFINDGNGHFQEQAVERGIASGGRSTGAAFVDIDNDGDLDLFVMKQGWLYTPLPSMNVFINDGNGYFTDRTEQYDMLASAYTAVFGDVDNDGDTDMLILRNDAADKGTRPKLYLNDGTGHFTLALNSGLEVAASDLRGGACADIDNDGDLDFYLTCAGGQNYLLRNDQQLNNHYLRIRCFGPRGDAGGIGTKVMVYESGHLGEIQHLLGFQQVGTPFGFLCQNENILHFGLAGRTSCDVRVQFTNGQTTDLINVQADQVLTVRAIPPRKVRLSLLSGIDQTGIVGNALPDSITVIAVDQNGVAVEDYQVEFQIIQGSGWINGQSKVISVTNASGKVGIQWTLGPEAGTQSLRIASVDTTFELQAVARADVPYNLIKVNGDQQTPFPGVEFAEPFSVRVTDRFGNPISDHSVEFEIVAGRGHLRGLLKRIEKTNTYGMAQVFWTTDPYLGPDNRLRARAFNGSTELTGSPTVWYYAGKPIDGAASSITATTPVLADGVSSSQITVSLVDPSQQPAGAGFTVQISVTGTQNTLMVSDTLTDAQGRITATLSSTKAERKIINAWVKGLNVSLAAAEVIFEKVYIPADSLALIEGGDQRGVVNQVLAKPIIVKVLSKSQEPIADYDLQFKIIEGKGKVNDLDSLWVKTDHNGVALVNWKLGKVAGKRNQVLLVRANDVNAAPLLVYATAVADAPVNLIKIGGDNQSVRRGQKPSEPLRVRLFDQYDNAVEGAAVHFTSINGGIIVTPQPIFSDSLGEASCYLSGQSSSGTYYFKADVDGTSSLLFTLQVLPNQPPQIISFVPEQTTFSSSHTVFTEFAITRAFDADGDSLKYLWLVNNQFCSTDSCYTLIPTPQLGREVIIQALVYDQWDTVKIIWNLSIIITEAKSAISAELPREWSLRPNYPNPFNPTTTLVVEVPIREHVELLIYDLQGRSVKVLCNETLDPGCHFYIWDGRDESGSMQSSGIYLCVLRAGSYQQTMRIALVK